MKKLLVILVAAIGLSTSLMAQNEEQLLAYAASDGSSTIEFLVEANRAVDELCNYFDGSWADVGLNLYCKFGGDVYTCTIYRAVKGACTINGAIRLYLEGDINSSVKKLIRGSADMYSLSGSGKNFTLKPIVNYTPVDRSSYYY